MVAHFYETIAHFFGKPTKTHHFCTKIGAQYALT